MRFKSFGFGAHFIFKKFFGQIIINKRTAQNAALKKALNPGFFGLFCRLLIFRKICAKA